MVRVFMSKMVMSAGDEFFDVELYTPNKKLKTDVGYIIGEYVYVYRGKEQDQGRTGLYKNQYGERVVVNGPDLDPDWPSVSSAPGQAVRRPTCRAPVVPPR